MTDLRQLVARAIHRYDVEHAFSVNDLPSEHHYGEADAVLAVLADHDRDAARPAARQTTETVVAYHWADRPGVLLCPEHSKGWADLLPLTSDDLPDGGVCAWGRGYDDECGRDVLIPAPAAGQLAEAHGVDYDRDPAAIAWARAKIQDEIDRCRRFHTSATEAGQLEQADTWRRLANRMERTFMGGSGCVLAYFDERLPAHRQAGEGER
ncbi:hypothetical protein [Streptomyces filamentosus]|uniref:hypothetical protein n=1 Tax=Streptomyces filamentosus TaxID=67294 RepID=UPI0037D9190F